MAIASSALGGIASDRKGSKQAGHDGQPGRLVGMDAADERTERPERLQPPEASRPDRAGRAVRFRARLDGALVWLVERVIAWRERARGRRLLASFDDRMLRDIGIDRARIEKESASSFWRYR
jgi:uncharacterized protein YjiS (DUF1127 family)